MTHSQAIGISAGSAIFGGVTLAFLIVTVPPQMPGGVPNYAAVSAFILSAALLVGGLAALPIGPLHDASGSTP